MQPNNMQTQPAMAQMPTPQPTPANYPTAPAPASIKPKKAGRLGTILAIIFGIIAFGAIAFIIFDKLKPQEEPVNTDVSTAPLSTRLSEISIPEGSDADIFKKTLAGRTFTVNTAFDEYITFTNESKYVFSYYDKPSEGRTILQASSKPGTYTVKDKTITLDNGESFEIVGDYLVKNTETISKNRTAVYFDALQLDSVIPNISLTLNTYLKNNKKTELGDFEKARIDRFTCHADRSFKKMTNADSYLCDTTYSFLFNQSKIKAKMEAAKQLDFITFCRMKGTPFLGFLNNGGTCNPDYTVSSWSYVIVRTDNVSYRVTGTFNTIEDSTAPLPRF